MNRQTVVHKGTICEVHHSLYKDNDRPAILLVDTEDHCPYMKATVNMPDLDLEEGLTLIKDYSENEGVLASLVAENIVIPTGRTITYGYVRMHVVSINN